jgi:hypothetical protein
MSRIMNEVTQKPVKSFSEVLYVDTHYQADIGGFCKPHAIEDNRHKLFQWYYCRDLFHNHLYNLPLFFFSHHCGQGQCVAAFLGQIEAMVDTCPRSAFGPTQRKNITWVRPSRWWTKPSMRRSLFTILMRAGCHYSLSKNNFSEALFTEHYASTTSYAINRFLAGNTVYTGRKRGWVRQFSEVKEPVCPSAVDQLLVSPLHERK